MKNRWFVFGMALAVVLIGGSAVATTLFYDGFNTSIDSSDIQYQLAERQSGSMAPRNYEEREDTASGDAYNMSQILLWEAWGRDTLERELDLGAGTNWGIPNNEFTWVSPSANFNTANVYEVAVKMSCWAYSGGTNESERYTGILIGANAKGLQPHTSTSGFGLVVTGNYKANDGLEPAWKLYDQGVVVASGYMSAPNEATGFYEYMHLVVDNTGTTTKLSVSDDRIGPLVTNYVSTQKLTNNYITLCGYFPGTDTGVWAMFDDLTVIDKTSADLSGTVDVDGYTGDKSNVGLRVEFMKTGQPTIAKTTLLDASGHYTVTGVPPGTYDVAFKTPQSLRTVVTDVTVDGNCDVLLTNGDADGDGHVTSTDLSVVMTNL